MSSIEAYFYRNYVASFGHQRQHNPFSDVLLTGCIKSEIDLINGHLLGDASIFVTGTDCKRDATFNLATKYEEYAEWLVANTESFAASKIRVCEVWDKRTEKYYHRASFRTPSNKELTRLRQLWYPEDKKIVPADLIITPRLVLRWYMDDGNWHSKGLYLNTQCFSVEQNQMLADKLSTAVGVKVTVQKHSANRYRLFIGKRGTKQGVASTNDNVAKFLTYIGDCPVKCFRHKWRE